ncbi:MAG: hypothetical protein QW487_02675 [Candidatus Bathyarchaeia archaeon]
MITNLLLFLSLILSLIFVKSEKLIYTRFSFCFATLFSSLTLYFFNKPLASLAYLTLLTVFSPGLIGFIENKFKLTLSGKISFKNFLSLILTSIFIFFILRTHIEAASLLASALIAFSGIIFNFNILKRFLSILLFEAFLFILLEIYFQKSFVTIILLLLLFFSSITLSLTANFIFKSKTKL